MFHSCRAPRLEGGRKSTTGIGELRLEGAKHGRVGKT